MKTNIACYYTGKVRIRVYKYHLREKQRVKRKRKKKENIHKKRDALNIGNVTTAVISSKRCDAQIVLDK